jgi:hypothetical protein
LYQPSLSTIRRTGRLEPSIPVSSSAFATLPPRAVMAHAVEDVAYQHVALRHVRLGDHPVLAAPLAHDAEEPRREGP